MRNRRILSIDVLRGLGIMVIIVIHRIHYTWTGMRNPEILKSQFSGPWAPVLIFTIALFTMAGIFYFISGLVNAYAMYSRVHSGKSTAMKAMIGGVVSGFWIFLMNYVQRIFFMNGFLTTEPDADPRFPVGLLTGWVRNPHEVSFNWIQVTDPGTLSLIGLIVVFVSITLGILLKYPAIFTRQRTYIILLCLALSAFLVSPYSKFYLSGIKKARNAYYANHFSTIGLVGMNELLLNFIQEDITTRRGIALASEIMDFMRKKLIKIQEETKNIFNLEATPAEATAYRLAQKDVKKYPNIVTAGTKEVPYYTNSSQLPVGYTDGAFEALNAQDSLQCKYTGGTVHHIFLGERISEIQSVKSLIKKVFEKFHLPYITLTPTFSICPVHGYLSGEHFNCPKCVVKQPCEVYTRIVGYLRPVSQFNEGKQQEFKERKEFKLNFETTPEHKEESKEKVLTK